MGLKMDRFGWYSVLSILFFEWEIECEVRNEMMVGIVVRFIWNLW